MRPLRGNQLAFVAAVKQQASIELASNKTTQGNNMVSSKKLADLAKQLKLQTYTSHSTKISSTRQMAILLSQTASVIGQKISTTALQVQLQQLPALLSPPYISRRQPTTEKTQFSWS